MLDELHERLTKRALGVESSSESQLAREFREHKRQVEAEREARKREDAQRAAQARFESDLAECNSLISEAAESFPHLAVAAESGEPVGAAILRYAFEASQQGKEITIEQAAKAVEESEAQRYARYAHLHATEGSTSGANREHKSAPGSKPTGSRTLTTTRATESPNRKPQPYEPDHEKSALRAIRKLKID